MVMAASALRQQIAKVRINTLIVHRIVDSSPSR
jgi:hypothetical protein